MYRYLCFPVTVDAAKKSIRNRDGESVARIIESGSHDTAVIEAKNHVPLFEGEQMAVVVIGRVLNESAATKVNLGQSA
jgi:hypothetical protein